MTLPFTEAEAVIVLGTAISILDRYAPRPNAMTSHAFHPRRTQTCSLLCIMAWIVLGAATLFTWGCGSANASFKGEQEVTFNVDGSTTVRRSARSLSKATNPPAASQPAIADAGPTGSTGAGSGAIPPLPKTMTDYIGQSVKMLYALGALTIFGAFAGWRWLNFGKLGALLLATAGVGLILAPSFIAALTPAVTAAIILIFIVAAVAVALGRQLMRREEEQATLKRAAQLAEEGKLSESHAALTTAPTVRKVFK